MFLIVCLADAHASLQWARPDCLQQKSAMAYHASTSKTSTRNRPSAGVPGVTNRPALAGEHPWRAVEVQHPMGQVEPKTRPYSSRDQCRQLNQSPGAARRHRRTCAGQWTSATGCSSAATIATAPPSTARWRRGAAQPKPSCRASMAAQPCAGRQRWRLLEGLPSLVKLITVV